MGPNSISWVTLATAGIVTSLAYFVWRLVQERRFYKDLPKPPHHWLLGHLKLMGETMASLPHDVHYQSAVTTIARKYNLPGVFYLDLWPASCGQVVVIDPDVAQYLTVEKSHPKHIAEKWFIDPLIGPDNIVTSDGPLWKSLHKMLSPAFSVQHISRMRPAIAEEVMQFRSILQQKAASGKTFCLEDITLHLTFDVVGKATFGHSLNAKSEGSKVLEHWEAMSRAFATTRESWNVFRKLFVNRTIKRESKKLDAVLTELIQERFEHVLREKTDLSSKKGLGIMDLILREHMEEIRASGREELDQAFLKAAITQVKTLLIAGSGTTSDGIVFAMMLLSAHPEVVQKLREEHDEVFTKGIDATYKLVQEEPYRLNKLEYTTNVIKEVLRFYPIGNSARAELPDEKFLTYQGERFSTAGKMICPVQMVMHMDDRVFPNAKKFDPDRFSREDFPRHAWRPFERGPRGCLGQTLAMDELKLVLLLTVRDFDFTCADLKPTKAPRVEWLDLDLIFGDRAFQTFIFEARPRDGMPMTIRNSGWPS